MTSKECLFSQVVFKSSGAAAHPVPHVFADMEAFHHWYTLNKDRIVTAVITPAPMFELTERTRFHLAHGADPESFPEKPAEE